MDEIADWLILFAADGAMVLAFLVAMYTFVCKIPRDKWFYWGWRIALAGATAWLAAKAIGHFYQPNDLRPYQQLGVDAKASYLDNPGFPSDHMLFSTFLTLAVWFATKHRNLTITMVILTAVIGLGRILALVHAPIDVLGGLLIPFIGIFWYFVYRHDSKKVVK